MHASEVLAHSLNTFLPFDNCMLVGLVLVWKLANGHK